jgi:hypothetical protein
MVPLAGIDVPFKILFLLFFSSSEFDLYHNRYHKYVAYLLLPRGRSQRYAVKAAAMQSDIGNVDWLFRGPIQHSSPTIPYGSATCRVGRLSVAQRGKRCSIAKDDTRKKISIWIVIRYVLRSRRDPPSIQDNAIR